MERSLETHTSPPTKKIHDHFVLGGSVETRIFLHVWLVWLRFF